ncbi:hypothetical protein HW555_006656 [Spodoptera exigua]|uniref:EMI domain-containing protein n=1 Tax=Spodoptera exigua TaxID=7107 RepID=A0A835L673_SPOEX|nr:hypothetical protein HW555_006656 [Spodoptera exigua]
MVLMDKVLRTIKTKAWCVLIVCAVAIVMEATALNGDNVCMVKQKYNITKRVKYRAPMSVRTYEWCFSMPPRCSRWNTEMRDLTRLETEERIAEVAVCCPGYKMRDVSCVPICPNGKTGPGCSEDCPDNKWGPNCIHECKRCKNGFCSPVTGECECLDGWQGESCDVSMPPTTATPSFEEILTALTTKTIPTTARITSTVTTPRTTVTSPSTTTTTPSTIATTPSTISTTPTTVATTPTTISTTPPTVATTRTTVVIASITPVTTPMTTVAPTSKATLTTTASTKNLFTATIDTLDTKEDHRNNMISTLIKETSNNSYGLRQHNSCCYKYYKSF